MFLARRFVTSEQLLRKGSELEMNNGCLNDESIYLNHDDPFLSNEVRKSFPDKQRGFKSDKRQPSGSGARPLSPSPKFF